MANIHHKQDTSTCVVPVLNQKSNADELGRTVVMDVASMEILSEMHGGRVAAKTPNASPRTKQVVPVQSASQTDLVIPRSLHDNVDRTVAIDMTSISASAVPKKSGTDDTAKQDTQAVSGKTTMSLTGKLSTLLSRTQDVELVLEQKSARQQQPDAVSTTASLQTNKLGDVEESFSIGNAFASGGQGILSKATDLNLNRIVAIKSLRKEHLANQQQRNDFITEARITAQLEHPAIMPIYSLHGDDGSGLHLAMKLVHGETLKSYLEQVAERYEQDGISRYNERKSLRYRMDILLKICDALEYAHNRNIMHRDLKPENIMIGEYREAYLMDWGIACQINDPDYDPEKWVKPDKITGTPRFLSPEAIRGEHCDVRADIYAMGLILYEITTLAEAYTAENARKLMQKICEQDMRPVVHRFGFPIDADLKAVIMKAVDSDRQKRYASMHEFSADVRRYLRGEEVVARPDSIFRKILRWNMNHIRVTMTVMLLCALAALGVFAFHLTGEIIEEKQEMVRQRFVGRTFFSCSDIAYQLDQQLATLETAARNVTGAMIFLQEMPAVQTNPDRLPLDHNLFLKPDTAPVSFTKYPALPYKADFDHMAYRISPGAKPENLEKRILDFGVIFNGVQRVLLDSRYGVKITQENFERQMELAKQEGSPVSLVYFTFVDGLEFFYPAKLYAENYEPRSRGWYTEQINQNVPQSRWGTPYLNANKTEIVMTYTIRMDSTFTGNPIGVTAVDVSISRILSDLNQHRDNIPHLLEQTFINKDGMVIYTSDKVLNQKAEECYFADAAGSKKAYPYPDTELSRQIVDQGYGYLIRKENDKEFLYVYSKCKAVGWFYFEKYDMDALMTIPPSRWDE